MLHIFLFVDMRHLKKDNMYDYFNSHFNYKIHILKVDDTMHNIHTIHGIAEVQLFQIRTLMVCL